MDLLSQTCASECCSWVQIHKQFSMKVYYKYLEKPPSADEALTPSISQHKTLFLTLYAQTPTWQPSFISIKHRPVAICRQNHSCRLESNKFLFLVQAYSYCQVALKTQSYRMLLIKLIVVQLVFQIERHLKI